MPDDLLHFYKEWDQKAVEAMKCFNSIEQPLKNLLNTRFINKVNQVAAGKEQMDSIISCYYDH